MDLGRRHAITLITFSVLSELQIDGIRQLLLPRINGSFSAGLAEMAGHHMIVGRMPVRLRGDAVRTRSRCEPENGRSEASQESLHCGKAGTYNA